MENLILVAAIGKNNELGLDNNLIWRIQEDLSFYRRLTLHNNIIMGRKTFESMPPRALEERNVFVISSKNLDQNYNINCFNSIEALLDYVRITDEPFIVVGGSQIYNELLPYLKRVHGSTKHIGKIPNRAPLAVKTDEETVEGLRSKLNQLIREEKYEEAAVIRDKIKRLEGESK